MRYIAEDNEEPPTIQEAGPNAYLALLVKGQISHSFPLQGEVKLGREKDNAVVVADQKVSRHHAVLTPVGETFIIQDQGSVNGTYVNGVRIAQPTRLRHYDQIALGDATFLFVMGPHKPSSANQAAAPMAAISPPLRAGAIPALADNNRSIWVVIGCMAAAIVALLVLLAIIFGLFLGRSQLLGLLLWWVLNAG
ncbi:MAG: FHA domain-containing protein [Chloroflexota bacterium]